MFESSLTDKRSSLANSSLYRCIIDLLAYLCQHCGNQSDADHAAASERVYSRLTSEISELVLGKLETAGDNVVLGRLAEFLLCLVGGKSGAQVDRDVAQKTVRFVEDEDDPEEFVLSSAATANEAGLTEKKTQGLSSLVVDGEGLLRCLVRESCSLSLRLVTLRSSQRHLRLLSSLLCVDTSTELLTSLLAQADLSPTEDASGAHDFLERVLLPLVDKFPDSEGSRHVLSMLTSVYLRLRPPEELPVLRMVVDRATQSIVCADLLSEVISSSRSSEDVRHWLRGAEFGKFFVKLVEDACRRPRTMSQQDDSRVDSETSMSCVIDNERRVDESHWRLICVCLVVNDNSGLQHVCLYLFLFIITLSSASRLLSTS